MIVVSAAFRSAVLLSMTVTVASEMHFHSIMKFITQSHTTLLDEAINCIVSDAISMIQACYQALPTGASLGMCI